MYVPLMVLNTVVFSLWPAFVGMSALPAWYWSIPQEWDNGVVSHGVMIGYVESPSPRFEGGEFGVFIGDLPTAVVVAVVFFALALLWTYVVVGTARINAKVARSLLGPPVDPLAEPCLLSS